MITTIYFIKIWVSDTHKTLTARRIFVHCLPINKFLLAVSKGDVPSWPEFFLVPPPLKKDNEDANASFVNRKKLTPLNRKAFSHHWSIKPANLSRKWNQTPFPQWKICYEHTKSIMTIVTLIALLICSSCVFQHIENRIIYSQSSKNSRNSNCL